MMHPNLPSDHPDATVDTQSNFVYPAYIVLNHDLLDLLNTLYSWHEKFRVAGVLVAELQWLEIDIPRFDKNE